MTSEQRNLRRALIVRRVAAQKRAVAMRAEWHRRRQEIREFANDEEQKQTGDEVEHSGSPDYELDMLPTEL